MHRVASFLAVVYLAATNIACMDQAHQDRALSEVEAVRRDSAVREAQLRALEQQQAQLAQQMTLMMALINSGRDTNKEDERDRRIADLGAQISALTHVISTWRDEERPPPIDPAARGTIEQDSPQERAAAVRKVQALLDAGQVKLTVKSGRSQLALLRPIDATDPYQPPTTTSPPKLVIPTPQPTRPAIPPPPPRKRAADTLGF